MFGGREREGEEKNGLASPPHKYFGERIEIHFINLLPFPHTLTNIWTNQKEIGNDLILLNGWSALIQFSMSNLMLVKWNCWRKD